MLKVSDLKEMMPHQIFLSGILMGPMVNKEGLGYRIDPDEALAYVAVRGGIDDWAIYLRRIPVEDLQTKGLEHIFEYTAKVGDKVTWESHIRWLVPCEYEAYKRYRY